MTLSPPGERGSFSNASTSTSSSGAVATSEFQWSRRRWRLDGAIFRHIWNKSVLTSNNIWTPEKKTAGTHPKHWYCRCGSFSKLGFCCSREFSGANEEMMKTLSIQPYPWPIPPCITHQIVHDDLGSPCINSFI